MLSLCMFYHFATVQSIVLVLLRIIITINALIDSFPHSVL